MDKEVFVSCDQCIQPSSVDWFNIGLRIVLVIGLILLPYLIYRKHKGEKGLWKKIVKWELIFFLIWVVVGILIWFLRIPKSVMSV